MKSRAYVGIAHRVRHLDDPAECSALVLALTNRRKAIFAARDEAKCAAAMDALDSAGAGSAWIIAVAAVGTLPLREKLTLMNTHRGRKHIGAWFRRPDGRGTWWAGRAWLAHLRPWTAEDDAHEASGQYAERRTANARMVGALANIMSRATHGATA